MNVRAALAAAASLVPALLCLGGLLALPQAFVYLDFLQETARSFLGWQVRPAFAGGVELARFLDPPGDFRGDGNLPPPTPEAFGDPGVLDLLRYTVRQPQTHAPWSDTGDYWQLELDFARLPRNRTGGVPAGPAVSLYIDTDGPASGRTDTLLPRSELVAFDPASPWDLCVSLAGDLSSARVRDAGESFDLPVACFVMIARNRLILRLPLDNPALSVVLDGRSTRHYVLVGAFDPWSPGHFLSGSGKGGLGVPAPQMMSRVRDCLVPGGTTQQALLGAYDDEAFLPAVLEPVEVPAWNPWVRADGQAVIAAVPGPDPERLETLAREADTEARAEESAAREAADALDLQVLEASSNGDVLAGAGAVLFQAGRFDPARKLLDRALALSPDLPRALAWRGAAMARDGGEAAGVGDKVRLVQDAYTLMDRAVTLGDPRTDTGAGNELAREVRLVRASVSLSVPQEVFGKALTGEADFLRAAELAPDRPSAAWDLVRAGLCREAADDADGALPHFQQAALYEPRGRAALEVARRLP